MTVDPPEVLLVEDNADDSAFVLHALAGAHLFPRLRRVSNGLEALTLLFGGHGRPPPDARPLFLPRLILLDLKLPWIDGIEVLRILKSNPRTQGIPVVVLSSSQQERDVVESYESGANSYLVKPMEFDRFAEAVAALGRYWLEFNRTHGV